MKPGSVGLANRHDRHYIAFDQQAERYPHSRARAGENMRLNPDGLMMASGTIDYGSEYRLCL